MTEQNKQHIEQKQGFKIKSGTTDKETGSTVSYQMVTDEGNGIAFMKDGGSAFVATGTSREVVGHNITDPDRVPAKVIIAKNGDIRLEAEFGDIILKAKNIRLVATDGSGEVTINAPKHFLANAPIATIKGTDTKITGTKSVDVLGTSVESGGQISNDSGSSVDSTQGSFLGALFGVLKKVKKALTI